MGTGGDTNGERTDEACADDLRALLAELRLGHRGHVEVYSVAA